MIRELTTPEGAASERLDVYLASALGETRSQITRWLRSGMITVNHQPARASYLVQAGDRLVINQPESLHVSPIPPELPIVYEDSDLLVIDKPAGIASHGGSGIGNEATVADFARLHTEDSDPERPGIVHRLDRDTSGLLIIAKTTAAKNFLQDQFRRHQVQKTYMLLVIGRPKSAEAIIDLPLERDPNQPLRRAVVPGGREAITAYRTTENYPGYSLLEAKPKTGRTHQLRVHFASLGHGIAGDTMYGPGHRPLGLKRHFLHATKLHFTAPTGHEVSLESPLPADLIEALQKLQEAV